MSSVSKIDGRAARSRSRRAEEGSHQLFRRSKLKSRRRSFLATIFSITEAVVEAVIAGQERGELEDGRARPTRLLRRDGRTGWRSRLVNAGLDRIDGRFGRARHAEARQRFHSLPRVADRCARGWRARALSVDAADGAPRFSGITR